MGTDKRARQKAGRLARIEAAEVAQSKAQKQRKAFTAITIVILGLVLIGGLAFLKRDSNPTVQASGSSGTSVAPGVAPSSTPAGTPVVAPPAGATLTGDTPCPAADGSAARTTTFAKAPPMCIDPAKTYIAKVSTSRGDFTVQLDPKSAPKAANNFVVLSRYHFYDGVPFHRIIPEFVVQGGDPLATGSGGPGYKFEDELPADPSVYVPGTLAMANSGPNTNGSQFFVVLAPGRLEAKYSLFGRVTDGFDTTVKAIAATGTAGGAPSEPTTIKSVTITES